MRDYRNSDRAPQPPPQHARPVPHGPTPLSRVWTPQTVASVEQGLRGLDPDQALAVQTIRRARGQLVKVPASAGAGKTHMFVVLVAALLVLDEVDPADIVGLTFMKKAATAMRTRLQSTLRSPVPADLFMGTFHSLAGRKARQINLGINLDRNIDNVKGFGGPVPSSRELWSSIIEYRKGGVLGTKERSLGIGGDIRDYELAVTKLRGLGFRPDTTDGRKAAADVGLEKLGLAWTLFDNAKKALDLCDYDDFLDAYYGALAAGAETWRPRWVLVDEGQDNNNVQWRITQWLSGMKDTPRGPGNAVLVGDGAQEMYSFRGAVPDNFCDVESSVEGAIVVPLPNNYRSRAGIVNLGNRVREALGDRWTSGLSARSMKDPDAEPGTITDGSIEVLVGENPLQTAFQVADYTRYVNDAGFPYGSVAILLRTNTAAAMYEGALMERGIPVVRWGGEPFWERNDVLTFVAYGLLGEPELDGVTSSSQIAEMLRRTVNVPKRFLSKNFREDVVNRFEDTRLRGNPDLIEALQGAASRLSQKSRGNALDYIADIDRLRKNRWGPTCRVIQKLMQREMPSEDKDAHVQPDEERRAVPEAVAAFATHRFKDGFELAAYAVQCAENAVKEKSDELPADRVVISTIHRFKGLERPLVFLPIDLDLLPSKRSTEPTEYREDLRLFYVGVTRAEERTVLVASRSTLKGDPLGPSSFIRFLDNWRDHCERGVDPPPLRVVKETR